MIKRAWWFILGHLEWHRGSYWMKEYAWTDTPYIPHDMPLCAYDFWKYYSNINGG